MPFVAITATDIDVAGRTLDETLPEAWLTEALDGTDVVSVSPGHVNVRLSRSGNSIVVRGRVEAAVRVPCARCLDPAPIQVDTELSLLLEPASKPDRQPSASVRRHGNGGEKKSAKGTEPEYEFQAEEAEIDTYDGETVVLDGFIREAILLELPSFPLCSEACPGIRPGASREADSAVTTGVDPRLAPLRALRDKLGQQSRPQRVTSKRSGKSASKSKKKE